MTACTSLVGESVITVYEKAMSRVWMDLEAVTRKHGVERELEIVVRVSWKILSSIFCIVQGCFSVNSLY